MMKRCLSILFALLLALALTACAFETQNTPAVPDALPELVLLPDEPAPAVPSDPAAQPRAESPPDAVPVDPGEPAEDLPAAPALAEDGSYTTKEDVALYLHLYGHLPDNFISKKKAESLGWPGGSLEPYAPGMCIGGGRFGNYEKLLPDAPGRTWYECDIDTLGARGRGAKRLVYSSDGLIYYTEDHYQSFELLYEGE